MKQVLLIGMSCNRGGVETFMMNIFLRLEGYGFHFTFINIHKNSLAYQDLILKNGGTIKHVKSNMSWIGHLGRYKRALNFFKYNNDYDIIDLNTTSINSIFWLKAAEKFHISKLIIHSHNAGVIYKSKIRHIFANMLAKYNINYLNKSKNIIKLAASKSCGEWMFGIKSNFSVINNGINTEDYIFNRYNKINVRKNLGIPLDDKVIITTARLEKQKNYSKIINVFHYVNKINNHIKLIIVGNGSLMTYIKRMVSHYNLNNYVYFMGNRNKDDVRKLLFSSDLMLMPSLFEAVPFSLTEAQASGVPALVSANVIPKSANITGYVTYLSLHDSDRYWANKALDILNTYISDSDKLKMNNIVKQSKYNIKYSIKQVKNVYLND